MSKFTPVYAAGALSVALTLFIAVSTQADPTQKGVSKLAEKIPDAEQSQFMRKKLEASRWILEGLTTEDEELIVKGAKALAEMSAAEKWQVHHDVLYKQFSNEFQRSAKSLIDAAEKGNFDAARLRWMDTTLKCIDCHTFVRGIHLAANSAGK